MNKSRFFKGVVLGAVVGALVLAATAAVAGNGVGGVFNLGTTNSVNGQTALQGATNGQQLRVTNTNTGGNASGIGIVTPDNVPPLAVHSKARVINLNADTVDGLHASQLVAGGGRIVRGRLWQELPHDVDNVLAVPGFGFMEADCDTTGYELFWDSRTNPSATLDDWWVFKGVTHYSTDPGTGTGDVIALAEKTAQLVTQHVARPGHTAIITTSAVWTPTGCLFNAQAVVQ